MTHVPPEGPLTAEIAIVGEAPGSNEEIKRRPFVGPAGNLLDQLLNQAGIMREACYVTNVMKVRPPKNDFSTFWVDKKQTMPTEQLINGILGLYDELEGMPNLKVVIAFGRQPMFILTGNDGITKWRGSTLSSKLSSELPQKPLLKAKVLPTFHPSFCLRQWAVIPLVVHDLRRAKELVTKSPFPPKVLIPYPTEREITIQFECFEDLKSKLSVDIECANSMISRISITDKAECAISIPFFNIETEKVIKGQEWIWSRLQKLLPTAPIIGQNFSFDTAWLWKKQGIGIKNLIHDTMIAQHVILPGLPSFLKPLSLAMLTSLYTDEPYYKDEGKVLEGKKPSDEQYGLYSARDAAVTFEVYQEQLEEKRFQDQKETFEFEMALVRGPIKHMMRTGVLVDVEAKEKLRLRAIKELEYLSLLVSIEAGYEVNLRSPTQVAKLLYDDMKLRGGVGRSTDEDHVKILQAKYPELDLLKYLVQHRGIEQVRKNILSDVVDDDSRMRSSYSPTTDTGRFKSSKNPFFTGTNMQNIPRDKMVRSIFKPDPGYYLIEADLEQAELRAVAYLAKEPNLIYLLEKDGVDIHMEMAREIMQKESILDEERQLGKRTVHAGNYLISGRGLVRACRVELGLDIKEKDAKAFLLKYFKRFPMIKFWHKEIEQELYRNNRTLITPFGRKRTFYERWGSELFRKATAFLPQSTISDLLNTCMLRWMEEKTVGDLLMQLHDAFYIQVPKGEVELGIAELEHAFNFPFKIHEKEVIIPVSFKVSECWGGEKVEV